MDIIKNKAGAKEYILDFFFPSRCPFCGKFITYDNMCCEQCFNDILWADDNICTICGKSMIKGCMCGKDAVYYDRCIPAAYYADKAVNGIYNLKYHCYPCCGEIFGRVLKDRLNELGILKEINAAVPVPMTVFKKNARGYNQAEIIARAIAEDTDIAVETKLLVRKNVHTEQHLLSAEERAKAVSRQYFAAASDAVRGKTVLLADDVLTTGATLNYCAYLLREKLGAERVICVVAATV